MAMLSPLFFSLLFFFLLSGGMVELARGQSPGQVSWCIAKPSASDVELQNNLEYACNNVASCQKIQPGGPCSEPQTLINKASVAMNIYYQEKGRNDWNCKFTNSGLISLTDPSYGNCKYDS